MNETNKKQLAPVPTKQIGIIFGSLFNGNLGVQALTYSLISLLETAGTQAGFNCEFTIFESVEAAQSGELKLIDNTIPFSVVRFTGFGKKLWFTQNAKNFFAHAGKLDVVFDIGGGDSFSDIYGAKRFASLCITKQRLKKLGIPVVMTPQTIGPFRNWLVRLAAHRTLKRVTSVYSRDQISTDYLSKNIPKMDFKEFVDMAFFLPFSKPAKLGGKPQIGLNVSGLLFNGGYTKNNQFRLNADYPALIHQLIDTLAKDTSIELRLVPHVITPTVPVEDDLAVCRSLAETHGLQSPPNFSSPIEAKSFISGLDFFLGARMHSTIAAFSAGVPVLPMAYSRKFNGLFVKSLNYAHMTDLKTQTADEIVSTALTCLGQRDQIRGQMKVALSRIGEQHQALIDGFAADISNATHKLHI